MGRLYSRFVLKVAKTESELISPDLGQIVSDESALSSEEDNDADDEVPSRSESPTFSPIVSDDPEAPSVSQDRRGSIKFKKASARKGRPEAKRQVSRSMSTAFAEAQQQLIEERIHSRRLDSFFSLHVLDESDGVDDAAPVYVSEVREKFMNPDFRAFMPDDIMDSNFLRGRTLMIRVWAKPLGDEEQYTLLIEEAVALPTLYYVAEDLDYSFAEFRDNTVLFHLPDGIYASYPSSTFEQPPESSPPKGVQIKSSSFDVLMKLKKLVEVIDDATATQQAIKSQMEELLSKDGSHQTVSRGANSRFALQNIRDAGARLHRDIGRLSHEKETRVKTQTARKQAFDQARAELKSKKSGMPSIESETDSSRESHKMLKTSLKSHTARVAEDLLYIFPIEPTSNFPLSGASTPNSSRPGSAASSQKRPFTPGLAFTIRGLHIPHASVLAKNHPPRSEVEVAAALGYVSTIVMFLSRTLLLHVPFPAFTLGSHSVIRDDITPDLDLVANRLLLPSQMDSRVDEVADGYDMGRSRRYGWEAEGGRTFPLYSKHVEAVRFRWAVYLLNKDIEELVTKSGLRVVDVRDTLANLRLLLVALAGGDRDANLPKREAGRIAGLRHAS